MISHHADTLRQKVALMEKNHTKGIKFEELDTEGLIEQLSAVEDIKRNKNMDLRKIDAFARDRPE